MILYKYVGLPDEDAKNYALDSLSKKYFYCSRPSQLNDVFDCHIPIRHEDREGVIAKWLEQNNSALDLNSAAGLDSYAFPYNSAEDVRRAFADGSFDDYVCSIIRNREIDFFHVLSLSVSDLNPVLWGTYADSNRGMCIGYKAQDFKDDSLGEYCGLKIAKPDFEKWNRYFTKTEAGWYLNIFKVKMKIVSPSIW